MSKHRKQRNNEIAAATAHSPAETSPQERQVADLAYELWRTRGCPEGSPEEDWFRAENELKARQPGATFLTAA